MIIIIIIIIIHLFLYSAFKSCFLKALYIKAYIKENTTIKTMNNKFNKR